MKSAPSQNDASLGDRLSWLIERIAAQDKAAFAEMFPLLAPRIKAYIIRLGSDAATAEELTQEVMLSIWRRAATFDVTRSGAFTWVFAIARNRRIDRLRSERAPEIDPEDPLFVSEGEALQDRAIEMREDGNSLRKAIKDLPAEQAELIQMAFFEEKPHRTIAVERHLPLGTVKSRLRLALTRLRSSMHEEDVRHEPLTRS